MARLSIAVLFAAVVLVPGALVAQAQEPEVPTAGPDQIVFTGEVPAPPGTTVTVHYLDFTTVEAVLCATASTTASTQGETARSRFVLIVDAACARGRQDPKICWGEGLCQFPTFSLPPMSTGPVGGEVFDTGLLAPREPDLTPRPPADLPATGEGQAPARSSAAWVLWAGAALLVAGLAVGGLGAAVRRRR